MIYDPDPDELGRRIESALDLLADDDHTGLAIVWLGAGWRANFLGSGERWAEAAEQAIHHSRAAGQRFNDIFGLEGGLFHGPRPADAALRTLDMALPENPHPISLLARAQFLAMLGRLEQARRLAEDVAARLIDMEGLDTGRRKSDPSMASIAEYEGDYDLAIEHTSRQVEWLETSGQFSFLSTQAAMLARWLCLVGRYDEAAAFAQRAREVADADDASAQKGWRQAQALVHAQRGEHGEAERLAREAVEVAERTDFLDGQAEAYADLAEVLAAAGRTDDAAASLEEALDRLERKEDVVMAGRVRLKLESLRGRSRT
jgi:tetratricopeptide (TPR) repeat protein